MLQVVLLIYMIGFISTTFLLMDFENYCRKEKGHMGLPIFWSFIWPLFWIKVVKVKRQRKGAKERKF